MTDPMPGWGGYRKTRSRIDVSMDAALINKHIRGHLRGIAVANRNGNEIARKQHYRYLVEAHDELMELYTQGTERGVDERPERVS